MADVEHNTLHGGTNQHAVHRWAHANQAARFAESVAAGDRGKVSWQQDNNTFWVLRDHSNVGNANGWRELDDVAAIAAAAAAQADATQALSDAAAALTAANTHASRHLPGGADEVNPLAAGANLTDADQTIEWTASSCYRRLPATTLSTDRNKTLGVATPPVAGSTLILDIYDQGAGNDVVIINGGSGGGTIDTIAGGTKVRYVARFDGTNWPKGVRLPLA